VWNVLDSDTSGSGSYGSDTTSQSYGGTGHKKESMTDRIVEGVAGYAKKEF
jgi:hypothetical protein